MDRTRLRAFVISACVATACLAGTRAARAQDAPHLSLALEGAQVWSRRNDVRIPPATGTDFSIVDLIGAGPSDAWRAEAIVGLGARHSLRFVYAPLVVTGQGTPDKYIVFADGLFAPGVKTDAQFKFTSYRGTYRYGCMPVRRGSGGLGSPASCATRGSRSPSPRWRPKTPTSVSCRSVT